MQEITGNLFECTWADSICITTNGFTDRRGHNVMGKGVAGEAKRCWPSLPARLGAELLEQGNQVYCLTRQAEVPRLGMTELPYHLVSFPTKPETCEYDELLPYYQRGSHLPPGSKYPGWMARSNLNLIRMSALQLLKLATERGWNRVVLPRPGVGAGGLRWEEVRPVLASILQDDRFSVVSLR